MKRLAVVLGIVVWMVGIGSVEAAEREKLQAAFGGIFTSNAVISGSGQRVTGISILSTASASLVGLYDSASLGSTGIGVGKWEGGAAANTGTYIVIDPPLYFATGVTMVGQNINGVVIYTEQPTP